MVYESNGKRVYLPYLPKPITTGIRVNSPNVLCTFVVKKPGISRYTAVISQVNSKKLCFPKKKQKFHEHFYWFHVKWTPINVGIE